MLLSCFEFFFSLKNKQTNPKTSSRFPLWNLKGSRDDSPNAGRMKEWGRHPRGPRCLPKQMSPGTGGSEGIGGPRRHRQRDPGYGQQNVCGSEVCGLEQTNAKKQQTQAGVATKSTGDGRPAGRETPQKPSSENQSSQGALLKLNILVLLKTQARGSVNLWERPCLPHASLWVPAPAPRRKKPCYKMKSRPA